MQYPVPYLAILDVGHGNSTILRDGDSTIVVDCGSQGSALLEFLTAEGIKSIDAVFLSHADQDHIGGLVGLLASDAFEIKRILLNADATKGSDLWNDLSYEISQLNERKQIAVTVGITRRMEDFSCGLLKLEITGPTPYLAAKGVGGLDRNKDQITSNSISASFHVKWKDNVIAYLAGDIDQISLNDLVDHKIPLRAPLLVFPHHGGKPGHLKSNIISFTEKICELIQPSTILFSIGRKKHENPRTEIVSTIRKKLPKVRVACTQLSKHCAHALPGASPKHLVSVYAKGRHARECCGGTFIVDLTKEPELLPAAPPHVNFITKEAPTSICLSTLD
ncbi:MBL fold metallo-hydrolase [Chryseolinea sp. H1M3-3]|uniref:ComEC/Rec2 family competence protein n=1 Tax=Chryseolinea sp. H1M3-3 TaxID=3034144 RepID=UPI0023EC885A|nr:MBL fold metallo-hydrolase [Chryseolinea sp. H1M3-3]